MKKVLFAVGIIFANLSIAYGFSITLGRDPFMDLVKLQELKRKEIIITKQKNSEIQREIQMLVSSLTVKMVVTSNRNPSLKAALIVGPSGIPVVVVKGQKLRDGVYVDDITDNGVKLSVSVGKEKKTVFLKIAK